ncbi:MAG: amidohydrolase [Oscillospiraceae bacterium]
MNILIKNAFAILPEKNQEGCDVYISEGRIAAIGAPPPGFLAEKTIDATDKLLVPGFINAHTHAYMTILRNRADDKNFMTWLFDNIVPIEDKLTAEDAYWGVQLACMEMLRSGVTSFLDMHMFPHSVAKSTADVGIRAVLSRGLQSGEAGALRIRQARDDMEEFKNNSLIGFMLAPHAPYTCDEAYLHEISELAETLNMGINTHLSESRDEQNTIKKRYNMTPAEYYDSCGILKSNTVCAHCVYLSPNDMDLLSARGVSVAHNPASNMKLGNGFANLPEMQKRGINVCLGTDGSASNNNLSILREMQLAALIHKGTTEEATTVTAHQVFNMATTNGAKALGLSNQLGEIRLGMQADLSLFNLREPGFFPIGDPRAALCYSSAGLSAETVLVNGRILLENGEYTSIDSDRVIYEIRAMCKRLYIDI